MTTEREDVEHPIAVAARVAKSVGIDFFKAFKDANSEDPRRRVRGMAQMVVLTIDAGEFPGREFASVPRHLPDTDAEQRALSLSKVSADASMRADLYAWNAQNREHHDKAAKALETAIAIHRDSEALINRDLDRIDEELAEWSATIMSHVANTWGVEEDDAPTSPDELRAWAWSIVGQHNPCPRWLETGEQAPKIFTPPTGGGARRVGDAMRGFTSRGGDDE